MAGTITFDIEGSTYSAGVDGNVWNRRFLIQGMTSGPSIPNLIEEAYQLIPNTGTPSPAPISGIYVRDATLDRIWCEDPSNPPGTLWSANGVVVYTTPARNIGGVIGIPDDNGPGITLAGSSSVVEIQTDRDVGGVQITTTYDNAVMAHQATAFGLAKSLTVGRLENTRPDTRKNLVEGTLNEFAWNGYAAKTVLCSAIDWSTDDGGVTFLVEYTFSIRADWTVTVTHEDPFFPGKPLPESDPDWTAAARTTRDMVPTSDFSVLNITL